MRDINRIPLTINLIEKLWVRNPDLRFGQIVSIIEGELNKQNAERGWGPDFFFVEDDQLNLAIKKLIDEHDEILMAPTLQPNTVVD